MLPCQVAQFLDFLFLITLHGIDLHFGQRQVFTASFHRLYPVECGYHLVIVVGMLIKLEQDTQHVCPCRTGGSELLIHLCRLAVVMSLDQDLSKSLKIGHVFRTELCRLLHACKHGGVVVHLRII